MANEKIGGEKREEEKRKRERKRRDMREGRKKKWCKKKRMMKGNRVKELINLDPPPGLRAPGGSGVQRTKSLLKSGTSNSKTGKKTLFLELSPCGQ